MKVRALKCPSCGANISVEEGKDRCFCTYCGTPIIIDDETQRIKFTFENAGEAGYQFEQGRQRAQFETIGNTELGLAVGKLSKACADLEILRQKEGHLYSLIAVARTQFQQENTPFIVLSRYWVPAAAAVLATIMAINQKNFLLFFFGLLFSVALYFALTKLLAFKSYKTSQRLDDLTNQVKEVQRLTKAICDDHNFNIVPSDYRTSDALSFISKSLLNGRAVNMNQAILQYEDYLQHEEYKEYQREQIKLQQRQLEELRNKRVVVEKEAPVVQKPGTIETAAAIGGVLYAGAKFLKEWNKRNR